MNRAEVFLGITLESRFRLDVIVRDSPDFIEFQGHDLQSTKVVDIRLARALRGMSNEELRDAIDTFTVEAEQLRQLSNASSHVEQLLASGQLDGPDQEHLAYCVFAHIDGVPLSQAHPKGSPPMPLARALEWLEPVASALASAHDLGVVHGDVRPENMIAVGSLERSTIKLACFTRATRLGHANAARTFSAAYGAPEHFKRSHGESGVGPATDTYGLALCLVELVTGQPPFVGSSPNDLYKQATDIAQRPTLRARGAPVSQEVDAVITRAVAVNPKLRWPNARDFWSALTKAASANDSIPSIGLIDANALAEAAGAAFAAMPAKPVAPPVAPAPPPPMPAPTPAIRRLDEGVGDSRPPPRTGNARLAMAVAAGIAAAIVAALVLGLAWRRKPSVTSPDASSPSASSAPAPVALPLPSATASASATPPVVAGAAPEGMIRIPAGAFTMGDHPPHRVVLTHAFYIDRTEVTIDAYRACRDKGACTPRIVHLKKNVPGAWGCNLDSEHGSYPANCVDRKQAMAYCAYANKRLPTEAEWEYAARGADEREYPWGSGAPKSCNVAVLSGMTGSCGDRHGTSPVGSAPDGASPFGVLDMGGNVWEWVADDYAPYPAADEVTDPLVTVTEPSDTTPLRGILRGGAWDYGPESAKTSYRLPFVADAGNASTGIRCVRTE
jgi:formylglycine-generating enzyme required for sulfatase activity